MKIKKISLILISVFIVGFSTMSLEITGSRILAPYLGNSIVVWTSIIGIILTSLSVGYYKGGRLSDQSPTLNKYSRLILFSSFFMLTIPLIRNTILPTISELFDLVPASIISSIVIFTPVNLLLGAVFPYSMKLALLETKRATSGDVLGKVAALSTFGNILGVFITGFILIPLIGSLQIIIFLATGLFVLSIGINFNATKLTTTLVIFVIVGFSLNSNTNQTVNENVILEKDTLYNHIMVSVVENLSDNRKILKLSTGNQEIQSGMYLDDTHDFPDTYKKFFRMAEALSPNFQKVLMLGGGAYTSPKDFLNRYNSHITVVEIDPALTKIATDYFFLKPNNNLEIVHKDATIFLNTKNHTRYDVVIIDVFENSFAPPFQITTLEAIKKISDKTSEDGIVMVNMVGSLEGAGSRFIKSEAKTYSEVFPNTHLFPVVSTSDLHKIQNIILVAAKNPKFTIPESNIPEISRYLSHMQKVKLDDDTIILTDNYSPVEALLTGMHLKINMLREVNTH
jgi:predicted membrane-bound spermidine synthase